MADPCPIEPRRERIVRTDYLVLALNPNLGVRGDKKRVVDLACGHSALTGASGTIICPRCTEMLRRSIVDGGADYEAFRRGAVRDDMVWPDDPCQQLNELHLHG